MSVTTLAIYKPKSIYEKITINIMSSMPYGRCNLTLPGGEVFEFGNGDGVSCNVTVHNYDLFKKFILFGDIGFGESYVDGDWDCDNLTNFVSWVLLNVTHVPTLSGNQISTKIGLNLLNFINKVEHYFRRNDLSGSRRNISEHYDLGNDFYSLWLDDTMTYSAAYFTEESLDLRTAQLAKYERLCEQLKLQPEDHVLEIGSGWGSMAAYMAGTYGCKVTTITLSVEQQKLARERMKKNGVDHLVNVELVDYRAVEGKFDKIVSIEMLEAVGAKYLPVYFSTVNRLLKPQGIFAMQVITCPDSRFDALRKNVDWIQKHIFPGSLLPSVGAINKAVNATSELTLVDLKDLGLDYAKTLNRWHKTFNEKLDEVKSLGFDNRFIRKWNYYLCYCEAAFAMRNINVMQMVYVRPNNLVL
ncbi:MAG: cyclopropane-fatty-acyl-phospholipid synthase family protein [Bacteroidota bacterium]